MSHYIGQYSFQDSKDEIVKVMKEVTKEYGSAVVTGHSLGGAIAQAITAQGLHTTQNQVKGPRLAHGWRRRYRGDAVAEARAETLARVQAALEESTCRCYGRGFLQSYLRLSGRNAREMTFAMHWHNSIISARKPAGAVLGAGN